MERLRHAGERRIGNGSDVQGLVAVEEDVAPLPGTATTKDTENRRTDRGRRDED